ncbi:uncharacterized protein LOC144100700 [Amblyomma americanum]
MARLTAPVIIGAIALQMSSVFGANETWTPEEKCLTLTLPNFINLGKCTKSYSDLCRSQNDGAAGLVLRILECFVEGMLNFNLATQAYFLGEFLKEVLHEADPVTSILEDLCSAIPLLPTCGIFQLDDEALCEGKIKLKIPVTLNISQCFGAVPITCIEGEVITEPLLIGFTEFVACLVTSTVKLGVGGTTTELLCYIVKIPELLFGTKLIKDFGLTSPLVTAVQDTFGVKCNSSVVA